MLHKNYDRHYAVNQIDAEVERIKEECQYGYSRQDQLLVDAAEVQILLGNDEAAFELLDKCSAGLFLVATWRTACEETNMIVK